MEAGKMYEDFVGGVQFWGYGLVSGSGDGAVRMWDSTSSISVSFLIDNFVNTQSANWTSPSNTLGSYRTSNIYPIRRDTYCEWKSDKSIRVNISSFVHPVVD